jgi:hypothetical protein
MDQFRQAVESLDPDALERSLAEEVVFHSPVRFKPFVGRAAAGTVLRAVLRVFTDFRYLSELRSGDEVALVFAAKVGDLDIEGIDLLHLDATTGLVSDLTVFVRPLTAAQALAAAVGKELGVK